MTNEKFTPGPWRFDPLHNAVTGDAPSSSIRSSVIVARMPHEVEPHHAAYARVQANARLIAAAPALFEALDRLRVIGARISVHQHAGLTVTSHDWSELHASLNAARAARAAARGES